MKNIILFASGNGSNAENICTYFQGHPEIKVAALFCNKADAKVIDKMKPFGIPVHVFTKKEFQDEATFIPLIQQYDPALIVLAGFLLLVPHYLVKHYPGKIINIHPALLPKYGGKGMYGHHVHEAVLEAKEKQHGITIHFVNEHFDEGEQILQKNFVIEEGDDLHAVSKKIAQLEMKHFPEAIEHILTS
jgi:phosphoribosylglycinamide formyltransferase-1